MFVAVAVGPEGRLLAQGAAKAEGGVAVRVAQADAGKPALRLGRLLGDDVDDVVEAIRSPQRATGSADHLDPVDVLEQRLVPSPEDAAIKRGIDAPAVVPKPRAEIAWLLEVTRATCRLGARRSASGSVCAPDRRMSSFVMTYMEAAAVLSGVGRFATEVISIRVRSSSDRLRKDSSGSVAARAGIATQHAKAARAATATSRQATGNLFSAPPPVRPPSQTVPSARTTGEAVFTTNLTV